MGKGILRLNLFQDYICKGDKCPVLIVFDTL